MGPAASAVDVEFLTCFVPFDVNIPNVGVLDLGRDGLLEYINRGRGWSPVGLFDATGHRSWQHPSSQGDDAADAMSAGDLDLNGDLEFVVGMNAGGGLRVLDERGRELARGITSYSSADLTRLRGRHSDDIESLLGYDYGDEVIHRNDLVLL